jgi:hypothetical protein
MRAAHHRREWIGAMMSALALADVKSIGEIRQHATALPAEEHRNTRALPSRRPQ